MKTKVFIFGIICSFIIGGCDSIEETTFPNQSEVKKSTFSSDEAKCIAVGFVKNFYGGTRAATTGQVVNSVYTWLSRDIYSNHLSTRGTTNNLPDTLLYIVNFGNDDGFVLVSADRNRPGVIAFVEKGSLTPNQEIQNPGFKIFLEGYREYLSRESPLPDTIPSIVDGIWMFDEYYAPLLSTTWGQHSPYNNYCFTNNGQQAVAGCMAIAASQIVAYHNYPSSYNSHYYDWSAILSSSNVSPSDPVASNSVAHLVHDIGLLIETDYGQNVSTAFFSKIPQCWNAFGYQYETNYSCIFDSLIVDMDNEDPIYMFGGYYDNNNIWHGHGWVIDGLAVRSYYFIQPGQYPSNPYPTMIKTQSYNLVHCNWGWNGLYDGFFIYGAFQNKYNLSTDEIISSYSPYNVNNYLYRHVHPNINN